MKTQKTLFKIESINDIVCDELHNEISLNKTKDTILHIYFLWMTLTEGYENYINIVLQKK